MVCQRLHWQVFRYLFTGNFELPIELIDATIEVKGADPCSPKYSLLGDNYWHRQLICNQIYACPQCKLKGDDVFESAGPQLEWSWAITLNFEKIDGEQSHRHSDILNPDTNLFLWLAVLTFYSSMNQKYAFPSYFGSLCEKVYTIFNTYHRIRRYSIP